jgi:hypothetical protein
MDDEADGTDLEEELRQVAALFEPVPPELLTAAVGAFAWRTIDAELAELVFDSLVDHEELGVVRGSAQERTLSFEASGLTIEVEITGTGASRSMIGQLVPPQPASVAVCAHGGGSWGSVPPGQQNVDMITLGVDELGRFSADALPAGPVSLRCRIGTETAPHPVVTEWVSI